jgi:hypothetical protein
MKTATCPACGKKTDFVTGKVGINADGNYIQWENSVSSVREAFPGKPALENALSNYFGSKGLEIYRCTNADCRKSFALAKGLTGCDEITKALESAYKRN